MKIIAAATALAVATIAPVHAQSFYPYDAAVVFCLQRAGGVGQNEAIEIAIRRSWDQSRPRMDANGPTGRVNSDVIAFIQIAKQMCPNEFYGRRATYSL